MPGPLNPFGYKGCVIWVPTIPKVVEEALEKVISLIGTLSVTCSLCNVSFFLSYWTKHKEDLDHFDSCLNAEDLLSLWGMQIDYQETHNCSQLESLSCSQCNASIIVSHHNGFKNPPFSIAILHTNNTKSAQLAKKLRKKNIDWYGPYEANSYNEIVRKENIDWSGPHEANSYNGGEADVVVFITDGSPNIQTLSRARRLLIILTCEEKWYCTDFSLLEKVLISKPTCSIV